MAGLRLDGAGQAKMTTLDEAVVIHQRLHSLVENYALCVKNNKPSGGIMQNIKRQFPLLAGKLKGQFGMIADQVSGMILATGRGGGDQTKVRALREYIAQIRQALEITANKVKEQHAVPVEVSPD